MCSFIYMDIYISMNLSSFLSKCLDYIYKICQPQVNYITSKVRDFDPLKSIPIIFYLLSEIFSICFLFINRLSCHSYHIFFAFSIYSQTPAFFVSPLC